MNIFEFLPGSDWLAKKSGIVFTKAQGIFLFDQKNRKYLDFASGNMAVPFGHNNNYITARLYQVLGKYWNTQDFMTEEKEKAFFSLKEKLPEVLERFSFHTSGTEAVEGMMRAVISATKRYTFIAFQKAFHGYTLGSRSLGPSILKGYGPLWGQVIYVTPPHCQKCPFNQREEDCNLACFEHFKEAVENQGSQLPAAFLFEPILGAGGIIIPPKKYYDKVVSYCKERGILIACDEILTGLWRFGRRFMWEEYNFIPDIITFAKGLGNGFPVMCVAGRKEVMDSYPYSCDGWNTTTFSGNTLSWVAASATLEFAFQYLDKEKLGQKEKILKNYFSNWENKFKLLKTRGKGMGWILDFTLSDSPHHLGQRIALELLKEGIKVNDSFHFIRFFPPLVITNEQLKEGLEKIERVLNKVLS